MQKIRAKEYNLLLWTNIDCAEFESEDSRVAGED
jgi:hypothetical protein